MCVCVISVGGLHLVLSLASPPSPTHQFLCSPHGLLSSLLACLSCGDIYWWAQCNLCSPSILSCPAASCLKNTAAALPPPPFPSPFVSYSSTALLFISFGFLVFFWGGGWGILEWHPSACLFICPQGSF